MSKISLFILFIAILDGLQARDVNQLRESELDSLIKSLLERSNAQEPTDRKSNIVIEERSDKIENENSSYHPESEKRKSFDDDESVNTEKNKAQDPVGNSYEPGSIVKEIRKELETLRKYRRSLSTEPPNLVRLKNLCKLYNKRRFNQDKGKREVVDVKPNPEEDTIISKAEEVADFLVGRPDGKQAWADDLVNALTIGELHKYPNVSTILQDDFGEPKKLSNSGFDFMSNDFVSNRILRNPLKLRQMKHHTRQGKLYHLQHLQVHQEHSSVWEDINKQYNFEDFESDTFIDLSLDCTNVNSSFECERLNLDLRNSEGHQPVPLRYVKDCLVQGRELALVTRDRDRVQLTRRLEPASALRYLADRVTASTLRLHQESHSVLLGLKVLQQKIINDYNMTQKSFFEFLNHHNFHITGSQVCHDRLDRCDGLAKYRSLDGSCNNLRNPSWGKSNTALVRILPAKYSDGVYSVPAELPNPRVISSELFARKDSPDSSLTMALVYWGQLLDHDLARVVEDQAVDGGIECCQQNGKKALPKSQQHHSCMPIDIPAEDKFYARYNQSCMNFVRSMTVAEEDCSILAPANQMNSVSSYLDLSTVYGSDQGTSNSLREFHGGRLRTNAKLNRVIMLTGKNHRSDQDVSFKTGDPRTNENPQLVVMQTLLVAEHNRVAYELGNLNKDWNDERLFQESRRVVIAEYQHVTYQHWLPLVLGREYIEAHGIVKSKEELSRDYDEKINPAAINAFTTAAFRFLHSCVQGRIDLVENGTVTGNLRLSDHYFRTGVVELNNNFESLLRGLVWQTMQKSDLNFDEEVSEHFYRSNLNFGADLAALDITRGRDHGLPGYNEYRKLCQLEAASDFLDLVNEISLANIEKLRGFYESVDDVDLFVGALVENRAPGSLLGPTARCLVAEQFYRSRVGDKYFYSHKDQPHSFTQEQFEEIKKTSLATLICDSGDALAEIQGDPFLVGSYYQNSIVPCYELPRMDLRFWKEQTT